MLSALVEYLFYESTTIKINWPFKWGDSNIVINIIAVLKTKVQGELFALYSSHNLFF